MKKYVIFYYLIGDYEYVYVDAVCLKDAFATADSFSRKTGAHIVGIISEFILNTWYHE